MEAISKEVAIIEVEKWLDFKKVKPKKREAYKDAIESIADAMCEGSLVLNEDFSLTQTLDFPIGAEKQFKSLDFKPRVDVSTIQTQMNGVTGADARILGTIAALTDKAKGIISKMDTEDYSVASSVAIFFL